MISSSGFSTLSIALSLLLLPGCVFRFTNDSSNRYTLDPERVYFPTAQDISEESGQAPRISRAVRRAIALDTRFELGTKDNSNVALDLQVVDSKRKTVEVVECKQGNEVLASGTRSCADLKNDFRFPDSSSEKEARALTVKAKIVSLRTGEILNQATLKDVGSGTYALVKDDTTSAVPVSELHSLRYLENNDAAVDRIGSAVASQVLALLLSTPKGP